MTRRFKCELSRTLSARVEETLRTNRLADVTLVTDNGAERIMAHQCVLSCSPVLRNLFLSREQRVLERVMVVLTGFRKNSVMALLRFLYTGEIELIKKTQTWQEFQELAKHLQIDPPVSKIKIDPKQKESRKRKSTSERSSQDKDRENDKKAADADGDKSQKSKERSSNSESDGSSSQKKARKDEPRKDKGHSDHSKKKSYPVSKPKDKPSDQENGKTISPESKQQSEEKRTSKVESKKVENCGLKTAKDGPIASREDKVKGKEVENNQAGDLFLQVAKDAPTAVEAQVKTKEVENSKDGHSKGKDVPASVEAKVIISKEVRKSKSGDSKASENVPSTAEAKVKIVSSKESDLRATKDVPTASEANNVPLVVVSSPPPTPQTHIRDEVCEDDREEDIKSNSSNAEETVKEKKTRRDSYTPVPLDDYPSNHFEYPFSPVRDSAVPGGDGDEVQGGGDNGAGTDFQMPAEFDIPLEIVKTQAEQAGKAKYAESGTGPSEGSLEGGGELPLTVHSRSVIEGIGQKGADDQKEVRAEKENVQENQVQVDSTSENTTQVDPQNDDDYSEELVLPLVSDSSVSDGEEVDGGDQEKEKAKMPKGGSPSAKEDIIKDLFGADDAPGEGTSDSKSESKGDQDEVAKIIRAPGPKTRISTLTSVQNNDLEAKRKRMVKRLKSQNDAATDAARRADEEAAEAKRRRKARREEAKRRRKRRQQHQEGEDHVCTSSCPGNHRMPDEDAWLVHDSDNGEEQWVPSGSDDGDTTSEEEEGGESEEVGNNSSKTREERLQDRYVADSGTTKKIRVSVQPFGIKPILELRDYRIKLLDDESSEEEIKRHSTTATNKPRVGTKRIKQAFEDDSSSDEVNDGTTEEEEDSVQKKKEEEERRKKKRLKEKRREKEDRHYPSSKDSSKKTGGGSAIGLQRSFSSHPGSSSSSSNKKRSPNDHHKQYHRHLSDDGRGSSSHHRQSSSHTTPPKSVNLAELLGSDFKHHYGPATSTSQKSTPAKKVTTPPATTSPSSPDDNDPRKNIFKMSFKKKPKPAANEGESTKPDVSKDKSDNDHHSDKKKHHQPFSRSNSMRILSDSE